MVFSLHVGTADRAAPPPGPSLGSDQSLYLDGDPSEQLLSELFLHPRAGFMLPTLTHTTWFEVIRFSWQRTCSQCRCLPAGWFKPQGPREASLCINCGTQERSVRTPLELGNQPLCNLRVAFSNHRHCVHPTCPVRWFTHPDCRPEANSSQHHGQ